MEFLNYNSINELWKDASEKVLNEGERVGNTKELNNVKLTLLNINNNILSCRDNFSLSYYLGEMIWYAVGSNATRFISNYGKIWSKLSDDGITNNSAYGYILRYKHGFNQIDKMIELLKKDPNSRRAVININVPNDEVIETHDEMCTIALQFLLRDGKLNATGIMRSNDLWTGTPYDIFYFTELQKYIANELDVEYGTYTHFVSSLHIYNRNKKNIRKSILNQNNKNYTRVKIDGQKIFKYGEYLFFLLIDEPDDIIKEKTIKICEKLKIVEYY